LVSRSSVVGFDSANYGASFTRRGNPTAVTSYADAANQTGVVTVYSQYDILGNVVKTIDAKSNASTIDYSDRFGSPDGEARGNTAPAQLNGQSTFAFPTAVTNPPVVTNQPGWTAYTQFDYFTGQPVNAEDINGVISKTIYNDPLDRPTQSVTAVGTTLERQSNIIYEDANRRIESKSDLSALNDNLLKSESFYDGLGRTFEARKYEDDGGYVATKTEYDALSRVKRVTNPYRPLLNEPQLWTESFYDALGRVTKIKTPDNAEVLTAYSGNSVTVTDQALKQRRSITNALGQLKRVDEPNDAGQLGTIDAPTQDTRYAYDGLNNLTTVTQGVQTRTFTYNSLSRLMSATNPESGTIQYGYDGNGNLTQKTDARNITTSYTYDALNRVTNRAYANEPSGSETPDVTYFYDNVTNAKGKLTKVTSSVSTTEYTAFDILGRVTRSKQITDGVTYGDDTNPMTYAYNLSGALVEQKYPSGRVVKNVLENDGDLSMVQSKRNASSGFFNYAKHFTYAASGAVTSMQLGNGRWESTQFNSRLQPTQIALGTVQNATDKLKLNYSYGDWNGTSIDATKNNGNIVQQIITVPTVGSYAGFTATQKYYYDSLNRIDDSAETIGATPTWRQDFTYDRYGNRRFNESSTTMPASFANPAITNPTISTTNNRINSPGYLFDNSGNTTESANGQTFIYDAENKQVQVSNASGVIGQYWYDGDGRRIKKYVPNTGETTIFVYDLSGKTIAEYSTIVANPTDAKVAYLTNDHLGSPRINTDQNGAITTRHDYHPFGEEIATSQRTSVLGYITDTVRKKFTGYERDDETALDYAVNRYHSPNLGRFTQVDPYNIIFEKEKGEDAKEVARILNKYLADPQNWNRYAYVVNNPLKYSDPDGLRPQTDQEKKDLDYLRNLANSSTDADFKRAVLDSVKGIEDAIAASKDQASDPRGLKIALWAVNRAAQPDTTRFAMATGEASLTWQGYTATAGKGQWKCNIFVAAAYTLGGGVNFDENGIPVTYRYKGLGAATGSVNLPTANDFASGNDDKLKGFERMANVRMGDIAAWANPGGLGHTAISIGGDAVIYAGPSNVKVNTLNATRQGLGANTPAAVFRRKRE
ncbi:MAG: RHS repeat domain-containing protein, partial [Pyrinomonadaceae bacterium]